MRSWRRSMSTRSELQERFGSRVRIRDVEKVSSGFPGVFGLSAPKRHNVNGPGVWIALVKRHVDPRVAKAAADRVFDSQFATVTVPKVEDAFALITELKTCGVEAARQVI